MQRLRQWSQRPRSSRWCGGHFSRKDLGHRSWEQGRELLVTQRQTRRDFSSPSLKYSKICSVQFLRTFLLHYFLWKSFVSPTFMQLPGQVVKEPDDQKTPVFSLPCLCWKLPKSNASYCVCSHFCSVGYHSRFSRPTLVLISRLM